MLNGIPNEKIDCDDFENFYVDLPYKDTKCFYCGLLATSKDHVWPVSYYITLHICEMVSFTVDSYTQCNSILNNRLFVTMQGRVNFIKRRLKVLSEVKERLEWQPRSKLLLNACTAIPLSRLEDFGSVSVQTAVAIRHMRKLGKKLGTFTRSTTNKSQGTSQEKFKVIDCQWCGKVFKSTRKRKFCTEHCRQSYTTLMNIKGAHIIRRKHADYTREIEDWKL